MQNDLISRSALLEDVLVIFDENYNDCSVVFEDDIENAPAVDAVGRKKLIKKLFPMGVPKTREEWNYSINARAVYEAIMKTEG